jgi:uncharacterized protein
MTSRLLFCLLLLGNCAFFKAQSIANFTSVVPNTQLQQFVFPTTTHSFQVLIEQNDPITGGNVLPPNNDFTGYIAIGGSSEHGLLCINSEVFPNGNVTVLNVDLDNSIKKWVVSNGILVNFNPVEGTRSNCSGGITPWGTLITCEENESESSMNSAGYKQYGWCVEVNPVTRTTINYPGGLANGDKIWKAGSGNHENACFNANMRTMYSGLDNGSGVLYKYVMDVAQGLSAGKLYALKRTTDGNGYWTRVANNTVAQCNSSQSAAIAQGASTFAGIEDVEVGPDGKIYFAVKNEHCVYRFNENDPLCLTDSLISGFETYVGGAGASYTFATNTGNSTAAWGTGNDNLAFDELGNLWVLQDGSNNYIWVVENGHTQANPKVKLFGISPTGAEPTGITFSPDFKYLFMSFQHPFSSNLANQMDAFGITNNFNRDITFVMARKEFLNNTNALGVEWTLFEAYEKEKTVYLNWKTANEYQSNYFQIERKNHSNNWETIGKISANGTTNEPNNYIFVDKTPQLGENYYRIVEVSTDGKSKNSLIRMINFSQLSNLISPVFSPNPSSDFVKCTWINDDFPEDSPLVFQLLNEEGKVVLSQKTTLNSFEGFSIKELPTGNYWVLLQCTALKFAVKMIEKRL